MSLPPIQSPIAEIKQKTPPVNSPKPSDNDDKRDFQDSLDSANKQAQESRTEKGSAKSDQSDPGQAASGGNELPREDSQDGDEALVVTSADLAEADAKTLTLQLGGDTLDSAQSDQALLLAAGFVVDSQPRGAREATADLQLVTSSTAKPEILARLQALTGQIAAPLQPTRQVADGLSLENLDTAVLKELGKTSTAQSSTPDVLTAQQAAAEAKALATPARADLVVPNRVGTTDWSEAMAGRITLMVNQRISSARIHLNPPELGPIEVKVNVNNDQASVQFMSQSAQVRDALEQSVPRLREMLESAGFSLADSGVSDQGQQGFNGSDEHQGDDDSGVEEESRTLVETRQVIGLVDDFV
ncbi:MAG: flagellar hook-length control protein FliK [Candidatus Azotimanducaceae bacterium]|jgi:flagellar hook-length control protein FliK